jgi:hypothetical protein
MKTRQRMTRYQAISLLIEYGVVAPENRKEVLGSETEIDFAFGGIDADKNGFFKRSDVLRLVSYHRLGE